MHMIKVKHNMSDVEDLATTVQLVLAKEFSPLDQNWQSEKFANLPEPSLKYLLSSDALIVVSENTVFHALMHWMGQNNVDADSLEETNNLTAVVRFQLVTIDYLYHPIASKMPKFEQLFLDGMIYHAMPSEQKKMLEEQPVTRTKSGEDIIVHTYLLNEDYSRKINRKLPIPLETFYACGYKMSVTLRHSGYGHYPYLKIYNLNKEGLVPLKFKIRDKWSTGSYW